MSGRSGLELVFVLPPAGSFFMRELADVLADGVRRAGGRARVIDAGSADLRPDAGGRVVPVLIAHEYDALVGLPSEDVLAGVIALGVEHPGTATFERSAAAASRFGAVVDINRDATDELERRGVRATHLQLGWSPVWDAWGGPSAGPGRDQSKRVVDVTVLATHDRERDARLAPVLWDLRDRRQQVVMAADEVARTSAPPGEVLTGRDKWRHLARSRVLLNLHRGRSTAFEWVRGLEAICNGCVVVSEPSPDVAPLVPGRDLVVAPPSGLGAAAAGVLDDLERLEEVRHQAYDAVRELDCRKAGAVLLEVADGLRPVSSQRWTSADPGRPPGRWTPAVWLPGSRFDAPHWRVPGPVAAVDLAVSRAEARTGVTSPPEARVVHPPGGEPSFAALVSVAPEATAVLEEAVAALTSGSLVPGTVVIVDTDGRTGAGWARNRASALLPPEAEHVHVQDGGLVPSREGLSRLVEALSQHPDAGIAYGATVEAVGLAGTLDASAERLSRHAYLGDGYVIRRAVLDELDGFTVDPWLDGLADHDLWCRLGAAGVGAVRVPAVIARRSSPAPVPELASIDPETVRGVLEARAPAVAAADPFPVRLVPRPAPVVADRIPGAGWSRRRARGGGAEEHLGRS